MNTPLKQGGTKREHLERIEKQSGRDMFPDELFIPPAGQHLWEWFWELNQCRVVGMGLSRISHSEIKAWKNNLGIDIEPWEIAILCAMDSTYLSAQNERKAESKQE